MERTQEVTQGADGHMGLAGVRQCGSMPAEAARQRLTIAHSPQYSNQPENWKQN